MAHKLTSKFDTSRKLQNKVDIIYDTKRAVFMPMSSMNVTLDLFLELNTNALIYKDHKYKNQLVFTTELSKDYPIFNIELIKD